MEAWPHQRSGIDSTLSAIDSGQRRILVTSPTGGGKTLMMSELIRTYLEAGRKVVLYTNRKLLVDQTSRVMTAAGHHHGIRAAGYEDNRDRDLQVSSVQTEHSRVIKRKKWKLHDAELVLVDEAHLQANDSARRILDAHHEEGAAYVGFTATPLGLGDLYDELVVAGTNSELRACGALVPCSHFGPDEPDLKSIGKVPLGQDLTQKQAAKAIMRHGIFARVYESWRKLNPEGKATLLFAPGVAESIWFAEQFWANGISAAHIDGESVWVDGKTYASDREARKAVLDGSRDGQIGIICNRFVLREGVDCPWLAHGIFATVFGAMQSYLQSGGRLLRAYPGLDSVTIQDHGGNWWRHGSLNADRHWELVYTNSIVAGLRESALRQKCCKFCGKQLLGKICPRCNRSNDAEREPVRCPQCAKILSGSRCQCGFVVVSSARSRPVIQSDGTLKEMSGDIFRPRRETQRTDADSIWQRTYYRANKAGMTFRQAEALFAQENNWGWPPRNLPLMPREELDWFRKVDEVPRERLT